MTVNVIGNGSVQQSSQQINTTIYEPYYGMPITFTGTLYSLTAVPSQGAQFDHWEYHVHHFRRISDDSGSTWRTVTDTDYDDSYWGNPYTYTPTYVYPGEWQMALLEGKRVQTSVPVGGSTYIEEDYFTDQSITCYFTGGPGPGPILRSDVGVILRSDTGVILHQG